MTDCVTVVVTCYNHEQYIEECLRSVFSQTHQDIALIVINDGSTDTSAAVIEQVLTDCPFQSVQFIDKENEGVCVTRNMGLELLKDDFILFLDSDNFLEPNYIETMLVAIINENADIVYCDLIDTETGEVISKAEPYTIKTHLHHNFIDNCSLIRKKAIGSERYDLALNRKKLEDYDFFLNLIINHGAKPVPVKGTVLNYRLLENSVSDRKNHKKQIDAYTYVMLKYSAQYPDEVKASMDDQYFYLLDQTQHVEEQLFSRFLEVQTQIQIVNEQNQVILDLKQRVQDLEQHVADQDQLIRAYQERKGVKWGDLFAKLVHRETKRR